MNALNIDNSWYDEGPLKSTSHKCPYPGCPGPEYDDEIRKAQFCVLNKPMLLYIPSNSHAHVNCPVHPEGHTLFGSNITM